MKRISAERGGLLAPVVVLYCDEVELHNGINTVGYPKFLDARALYDVGGAVQCSDCGISVKRGWGG